MVEKNLGIAFFSTLEIKKEVESNWMHTLEIEDDPFYRYIHVIYHKNHELSPTAKAFYDFMFAPDKQMQFLRENETECPMKTENGDGIPENGRYLHPL